jgi:hypothetical protein
VNDCGGGPPDVVEDLGNGASCGTYTACSAGVKVGLCSIHGTAVPVYSGHILYLNTDGIDVAQRAWSFMSQFTLPTSIPTTTSTTLPPPCPVSPASGCQPALSRKAAITLDRSSTPAKKKFAWTWVSSGSVVTNDFGDPTASTGYKLCVYDASGRMMTATGPAGGICTGKPCWTLVKTGAKYSNKALTPDGILKISLKAGEIGKAKIKVKGKGASLQLPGFPLDVPVQVQLRREDTGACWEGIFSSALVNTGAAFKGRSD